jgi:hypothetical protein
MMNRLSLAVFLTIAGAPFAAGSIVTFEIVSSSLGASGGAFNGEGNYFGTFSLDTSLLPTKALNAFTLSSVDVTTTASNGAPGEHFTAGMFGLEEVFADPMSHIQYDSDSVIFDTGSIGGLSNLELTLIELHGTFAGGQISEAEDIEEGGLTLVLRLDTSGRALLVDPALVTPEPVTWTYFLLGGAAIALARVVRKRERIGAR